MNAGDRGNELAKFVVDEINGMSSRVERDIMTRRVLRAMEAAQLYELQRPFVPDQMTPMSDAEARAFGEEGILFGMHTGTRIKDIPREYLCVLVDPTPWKRNLRRWLKSTEGEICTCHERDSSYVCGSCYKQGFRGHMQKSAEPKGTKP